MGGGVVMMSLPVMDSTIPLDSTTLLTEPHPWTALPHRQHHALVQQWRIYIVKFWMRAPRGGPNSFNFMQFLGTFGKIICWCYHLGS